MSTRKIPGSKDGRCVGLTTYHLHVPNVKKIRGLNLPDPQGPVQACCGTAKNNTHSVVFNVSTSCCYTATMDLTSIVAVHCRFCYIQLRNILGPCCHCYSDSSERCERMRFFVVWLCFSSVQNKVGYVKVCFCLSQIESIEQNPFCEAGQKNALNLCLLISMNWPRFQLVSVTDAVLFFFRAKNETCFDVFLFLFDNDPISLCLLV
jgi:hypothetical protein